MSEFVVKVRKIEAIEPIPNADAIELAVVGDYRSVVVKGDFQVGDLAVYIPEASIVPNWLLEKMGLEGKLSGKEKNRVKAIKLRGCLSQGILYPTIQNSEAHYIATIDQYRVDFLHYVQEGDDVSTVLGITKWEPPIPAYMSGEVYNAGQHLTVKYDIENIKAFPSVIRQGEDVVFTEKIHGTFCGVGIVPVKDYDEKHFQGKFVVFSKGLGAQGLCFKDTEKNRGNVYFRALLNADVFNKLEKLIDWFTAEQNSYLTSPIFLLGEVYGKGVQDLSYGTNDVSFRIFDICYGYRDEQQYHSFNSQRWFAQELGIDYVPILYQGPFYKDDMLTHTKGIENVSGNGTNIREGIVIKPAVERTDPELGRVILKSVSEDYLLRKGNVTEYQ